MKPVKSINFLVLGIITVLLSACSTCKSPYRQTLTDDYRLAAANESYKKAIDKIDEAYCSSNPHRAQDAYQIADQYLSDAAYKLKQLGHDNQLDVNEDIFYVEKVQSEIRVDEGVARKEGMVPTPKGFN